MKENPYQPEQDEIRELLKQYSALKNGRKHSFLDEDCFEKIIDYYDGKEEFVHALEAAETGIEQYPFSSVLLIRKADLLIATRKYPDALQVLERVELLDSNDINLYILKTDAYLALDQQRKAAEILEEAIHIFDGEEKIELLFEL